MKKIVIDARCIFDSGIGVYTQSVIKELLALGRIVELVLHNDDRLQFEKLELSVSRVHFVMFGRFSVRNLFWNPQFITKDDVFFNPSLAVPSLLIKSFKLLTIHDFCPIALRHFFGRMVGFTYWALLFIQSLRADRIICISEFTKSEFSYYFPFLGEERVSIIYNGLTTRSADSTHNPAVGTTDKYILCVGNVKPHKNVVNFAKFYSENSELRNDYKLVIVGQSTGFRTGEVDIETESEHVKFTGYVSDAELAVLYAGASLFVFPSFYEGFGLPLIEAASVGVPVVCSDIPVFREIGNTFCKFFDPSNFNDFDKAAFEAIVSVQSGELAGILKEKFSWKNNVSMLLELVP